METIVELDDRPSGLGWSPQGRLLVVGMKKRQLLRLDPGGLQVVAELAAFAPAPCNDTHSSADRGSACILVDAIEPRLYLVARVIMELARGKGF